MRIAAGRIEFRVRKIPWPFPTWVHAVTIWPVIVYEEQVWEDECVLVHERYHWADQLRWLVLPWFLVYLTLRPFTGGGSGHPLEREAYRREAACRVALAAAPSP
jgi:hypothetical protein